MFMAGSIADEVSSGAAGTTIAILDKRLLSNRVVDKSIAGKVSAGISGSTTAILDDGEVVDVCCPAHKNISASLLSGTWLLPKKCACVSR